jgi:hypothetical protein
MRADRGLFARVEHLALDDDFFADDGSGSAAIAAAADGHAHIAARMGSAAVVLLDLVCFHQHRMLLADGQHDACDFLARRQRLNADAAWLSRTGQPMAGQQQR